MSRSLVSALLVALTAAAPATAAAATTLPGWGAEVRLGPYRPKMGDAAEEAHYDNYFGGNSPLIKSLEVERYVYDYLGNVGVFLRVGHWKVAGNSITCADSSGNVVDCGSTAADPSQETVAPDSTAIVVVPISIGVLYRFTMVKDDFSVPLVPYAKLGLDYYLWWFQAGGKTATLGSGAGEGAGKDAKGATAGFHGALGLQFNLDWIEASEGGKSFIDSYLFAEVEWLKADSFGKAKTPHMTPRNSGVRYVIGLAFDFE